MRLVIHTWRKHGGVVNLSSSGQPTKSTPSAQLIYKVTKEPHTTSELLAGLNHLSQSALLIQKPTTL